MVVPRVREAVEGDPAEVVVANARCKAEAGAVAAAGNAPVLAIDTDVVLDGRLLGKPDDAAGARERLEALSGRSHEVLSGVVVLERGQAAAQRSALARTEVRFRRLDPATLRLYLDSGEWSDRAGAYAIQGLGSILVEAIEGDFSNVVGLPLATVLALLPSLLDA